MQHSEIRMHSDRLQHDLLHIQVSSVRFGQNDRLFSGCEQEECILDSDGQLLGNEPCKSLIYALYSDQVTVTKLH